MSSLPVLTPTDIAVVVLSVGWVFLLPLLVLTWPNRRSVIRPQMRPIFYHHIRPSLPEGHNWPDWHDSHDGVFEKWVCRDCGVEHLRKMAD